MIEITLIALRGTLLIIVDNIRLKNNQERLIGDIKLRGSFFKPKYNISITNAPEIPIFQEYGLVIIFLKGFWSNPKIFFTLVLLLYFFEFL